MSGLFLLTHYRIPTHVWKNYGTARVTKRFEWRRHGLARVHFYQQHKAETADRVTRGSEDIVTIEQVCWMHSWCKLRQARCEAVV